jgi:hypothetical protein
MPSFFLLRWRSYELFVWLTSNHNPLNLSLPDSYDYRCEPPIPSSRVTLDRAILGQESWHSDAKSSMATLRLQPLDPTVSYRKPTFGFLLTFLLGNATNINLA